ncbi:hypothetical protein FIV34_10685 [Luteibacter pinisoli]|uniref:Uncharacterized protein n=1 Tax=Luteibacter pinisoli TaxID=2589080 RepID=A0A4Y5Z3Z4_9GAMM|nr:hypothetical protein [Luteibacter pinisoli]QDE39636.1 hypothetical protein FIV34_10685 [Luteibacter pinisoli]
MAAVIRRYRAALEADQRAWTHALRPNDSARSPTCRFALVARNWPIVGHHNRSVGGFARPYPEDDSMRVSHETIYRGLFILNQRPLKKSFWRIFVRADRY